MATFSQVEDVGQRPIYFYQKMYCKIEILNECRPKMCCGYQAKKEISDTMVDGVRELLIINRKNDYRLPSELCDTFHVKRETHVAHISDSNDFFTALIS